MQFAFQNESTLEQLTATHLTEEAGGMVYVLETVHPCGGPHPQGDLAGGTGNRGVIVVYLEYLKGHRRGTQYSDIRSLDDVGITALTQ